MVKSAIKETVGEAAEKKTVEEAAKNENDGEATEKGAAGEAAEKKITGEAELKETAGEAELKAFFKKNKIKLAVPVYRDELVTINFMIVNLLWVHAMNKKTKDLNYLFGFNSNRIAKDLATGIKNHTGAHSASKKYINSFCNEKLQIPPSDFNGDGLLIPDVNIKNADDHTSMRMIYKELVAYRRLSVMANHSKYYLNETVKTDKDEINAKILKGLLSTDDWKEVEASLPRLKNTSLKSSLPEIPKDKDAKAEEDYVLSLINIMQNEVKKVKAGKDDKDTKEVEDGKDEIRKEYFHVVRSLRSKYEKHLIERLKKYYDNSKMASDKQSFSFFKLLFYLRFVYDNPDVHKLVTSITKQMKLLDAKDFSTIAKLPDSTKDDYIEELTRQLAIFKAAKYY